jgi:hypothetical protein
VAYWNFEESLNDQRAFNITGHGHNGTLGSSLSVEQQDPTRVSSDVLVSVASQPGMVSADILSAAVPNPFTESMRLRFRVSDSRMAVTLHVYDMAGRLVRELLSPSNLEVGEHTVQWDGRGRRWNAEGSRHLLLSIERRKSRANQARDPLEVGCALAKQASGIDARGTGAAHRCRSDGTSEAAQGSETQNLSRGETLLLQSLHEPGRTRQLACSFRTWRTPLPCFLCHIA